MSNVENLSPQIIRRLVKEMHDLVNDPPEGIKVNLNEDDVTDIQAYIEGPGAYSMYLYVTLFIHLVVYHCQTKLFQRIFNYFGKTTNFYCKLLVVVYL